MKKFLIITFVVSLFYGCAGNKENIYKSDKNFIIQKYSNVHPKKWSENIDGVIKNIPTNEKVLALTLDLCGSKNDSLDEDLVTFLIENEISCIALIFLYFLLHIYKLENLGFVITL